MKVQFFFTVLFLVSGSHSRGEARYPVGGTVALALPSEPVETTHDDPLLLADQLLRPLFDDSVWAGSHPLITMQALTPALLEISWLGQTLTKSAMTSVAERLRVAMTKSWRYSDVKRIEPLDERKVAVYVTSTAANGMRSWPSTEFDLTFSKVAADRNPAPYALGKANRDESLIALTARHTASNVAPYVDSFLFRWFADETSVARAYERGELALSLSGDKVFSETSATFESTSVTGPANILLYVRWGKRLRDIAARRALHGQIDRGRVASLLEMGQAAHSPWQSVVIPRSASSAQTTAELAGLAQISRQKPIQIGILQGAIGMQMVSQYLVAWLFEHGVSAQVTALPARELVRKTRSGNLDISLHEKLFGELTAVTPALVWALAQEDLTWLRQLIARGALTSDALRARFLTQLPIVPLAYRPLRVWYREPLRRVRFLPNGGLDFAAMYTTPLPSSVAVPKP